MPWVIQQTDNQWCIYEADADGNATGESQWCHDSEAEAKAQLAALYATENEATTEQAATDEPGDIVRETVQATVVSEFGGEVPSVPFAPGVSVQSLTTNEQGETVDPDPFFLVLPISETGQVSKNGLLHDEQLANTLVNQIMMNRPGGIMGHIPDDMRNSAYPVSQIHWVGATQHGGRVWAKGYVPTTMPDVREEFRLLKAKGGKAATSIYGRAIKELDEGAPGRWRARQFVLEQIDLAPHARASLPGSGEFALTAEMEHNDDGTEEESVSMDRDAILAELTADDIKALPAFKNLRDALLAEFAEEHEGQQRVAELEAQTEQQATRIAELEADVKAKDVAIQEFQQRQFGLDLDAKIAELTDWQVTTDEGKEKLASLRRVMRNMVLAKLGAVAEIEQATETLEELMAGSLKPLAELTRDALAGPAALVPGKDREATVQEIDDSEAAGRAAMAKLGLQTV